MDIDRLVARAIEELGATVGEGPGSATGAAPEVQKAIDTFLASHPALSEDDTYVEFLEKYAGMMIEDEEQRKIIDVLGFSACSTGILEMDGPVVDKDGFLVIAQCIYSDIEEGELKDTYEYDFAYSVTGVRAKGIYQCAATMSSPNQPFEFHSGSFAEWLSELLDKEGDFGRPALS